RTEYREACYERGGVWLPNLNLQTRILVGADGPQSRVARSFNLGRNQSFLVGVETEYEGVAGVDPNRLHCFLDSQFAPGYIGWVVPGIGITQIGLACSQSTKPDLEGFTRKLSKIFDFTRSRIVGRRGGLIPTGGVVKPFFTHHVFLIGDAAGL